MRWPHHSWRDTFQSRMLVSQCSQVFSNRSGRMRVRPWRVASRARAASGPVRTNHWVLSRGSMTSLLRWQRPMTISCGVSPARSPRRLEVGDDRRPRGEPVHPVVAGAGAGDGAVVGEDRRGREAVAQARLVVVVVVGRGDLDRAGPERRVDHVVGDDRHVALDERDPDGPADERGVARVVRMDRDRGVAEDRLGAGRGDGDRRVRVGLAGRGVDQVVAHRPERPGLGRRRSPRGR